MNERDPKQVEKLLERFERDKKRQAENVLRQVERLKQEAEKQKLNVTTITEEQLKKKLAGTDSPMIVFQSWNSSAAPGGTINYNVGINNPDPFQHIWLFVHMFVGPANIISDAGAALAAVDPRFPRLSMPEFSGLTIAPGDTQTLSFTINIPANVEASNYLGNSFLFGVNWHDIGDYFDRSIFVFQVT